MLQSPLWAGKMPQCPLQASHMLQCPLWASNVSQRPLWASNVPQRPLKASNTPQSPLWPGKMPQRPLQASNMLQSPLQPATRHSAPSSQQLSEQKQKPNKEAAPRKGEEAPGPVTVPPGGQSRAAGRDGGLAILSPPAALDSRHSSDIPQAYIRYLSSTLRHSTGCVSLSGPGSVHGTVRGSLSVRCTYEQEDENNSKYWCESSCWTRLSKVVETSETQREARKGRVTIRDDPASLAFTVTLENLTKADKGTYWCGVSRPGVKDPLVQVVVYVSPAPAPKPTQDTYDTRTQTSPWATERTSVWSTTLTAGSTPHSAHGQDGSQPAPTTGVPGALVSASVLLLLLLLAATALLAWRMVRRQGRAAKNRVPGQEPHQAVERSELEPCYANLELKVQPPGEQPEPLVPPEVEYSNVEISRGELHYSTVMFGAQGQASQAHGGPPETPSEPEVEYSVIRKKT
ncbi:CMRF35-like molecule 8 [Sorex araneus]|uniref:CMRF35-like molecule 8 n=1 Tax=Sorex araneus TaxID=42254 RepID=UPI002433D4EC|nr:CMRF35-like molecule 8 [Sorex araneus]